MLSGYVPDLHAEKKSNARLFASLLPPPRDVISTAAVLKSTFPLKQARSGRALRRETAPPPIAFAGIFTLGRDSQIYQRKIADATWPAHFSAETRTPEQPGSNKRVGCLSHRLNGPQRFALMHRLFGKLKT